MKKFLVMRAALVVSSLMFFASVQSLHAQSPNKGTITFKTNVSKGETVELFISKERSGMTPMDANELEVKGAKLFPASGGLGLMECKIEDPDNVQISGDFVYFECTKQKIKEIDLTQMPQLEVLRAEENSLTAIDLSKSTALHTLSVDRNGIESVDLSGCPNIVVLNLADNRLKTIDVSQCKKMTNLLLMNNQFETVDVRGCDALEYLSLPKNAINKLEFSEKQNYYFISLESNNFSAEEMSRIIAKLQTPRNDKSGAIIVVDGKDPQEKNVCYKKDVDVAVQKKWNVYDKNGTESEYGIPFKGSDVTGNEGIVATNAVHVYPNPANEIIWIRSTEVRLPIRLFNAEGKLVARDFTFSDGSARIEVQHLPKGVYFLSVGDGIQKVILQ